MLDKPLLMALSSVSRPIKWNTFYAVSHAVLGYAVAKFVKAYLERCLAGADELFKSTQAKPIKYVACLTAGIASVFLLYFTSPLKLSRDQFLCLFLAHAFIGSGSFICRRSWGKSAIAPLILCTCSAAGATAGYLGRPALLAYGLVGASLAV
jgi:hypothetical protein